MPEISFDDVRRQLTAYGKLLAAVRQAIIILQEAPALDDLPSAECASALNDAANEAFQVLCRACDELLQ